MKLREVAYLADENIDLEVVAFLRAAGLDVLTATEAGLLGRADSDVLRAAWQSRRACLTHDPDFGALAVAAQEPVVGIIHVRPGHIEAPFTIASLQALLASDPEVEPPFVVVVRRRGSEVAIRVRHMT